MKIRVDFSCFPSIIEIVFRLDEIQSENMKLKVENTKLSRKVDSIKNENHNIGVMEQEKDSLKQTVAQMRATIDSLQKTQSKQVRIESSIGKCLEIDINLNAIVLIL